MATKTLFAFVALCALAAVSASPAARVFQDADLEQMDKFDFLDETALQSMEGEKFRWINATEILEKIEQSLKFVEDKIELVSEEVQNAVEAIVEGIEDAAASAAQKWSEDVAKWVAKANETNIDVQICLDESEEPLADVALALKEDARKCISGRLEKLNSTLTKVKAAGPALMAILEEAKATIEKCNSQGNPILTGVCLMKEMPLLQVKAASVVFSATVSATFAAAEAAAIVPMATLCTSRATAGHAAEISAIVDTTITCIKSKIAA